MELLEQRDEVLGVGAAAVVGEAEASASIIASGTIELPEFDSISDFPSPFTPVTTRLGTWVALHAKGLATDDLVLGGCVAKVPDEMVVAVPRLV